MDTNPAPAPTRSPNLVSLSMGAVVLLAEMIAKSDWATSPKEKIAAGRLKGGKLEDLIITQPDPCVVDPRDPNFRSANLASQKALREWNRTVVTIELSDLEKIACTSCAKFTGNKAGATDENLAMILEQFGIKE